VFVKVWQRAAQWRGDSSAGTWIYRIALRTVLDHERQRHRWWRRWAAAVPGLLADPQPGPAQLVADREQQRNGQLRLQAALAQLPEADRALVHLHYFENHKLADLEPLLGASRDALKMRLARARQKLRDLLGPPDAD
jgi:RNA polymerase sigma-70 factor (ECF subfamily)